MTHPDDDFPLWGVALVAILVLLMCGLHLVGGLLTEPGYQPVPEWF